MAKKRKNDGDAYIILIMVLLFIVAMVMVIAPLFLIGASIYFTLRFKTKYGKLKGSLEDFWLNGNEKAEFRKWTSIRNEAVHAINDAVNLAEENEVSRNNDGRFSARSNLGKQVQNTIDENTTIYHNAFAHQDELAELPKKKWNKFFSLYRKYFAYRIATIAYFITLVIVCQINDFNLSIENALKFGYNLYRGFGEKQYGIFTYTPKENWLGMLLITSVSVVVYFIARYIARHFANKITPEPPKIDIQNIASNLNIEQWNQSFMSS